MVGGAVANVGDVAYWDGSKVKTVPLSDWNTSLGTPVGVVVIPTGFVPDGKARIVSLYTVDSYGNQSTSYPNVYWASSNVDCGLNDFTVVPITDNTGYTSDSSSDNGYLPSDNLTGETSYVDQKAKYHWAYDTYVPSPYLGDGPNPEYYKILSGNNALSDFDGLGNTLILKHSPNSVAGLVAGKYKDSVSNLRWHLPTIGELGYLIVRLKEIDTTMTALGGVAIVNGYTAYWSSTEYNSSSAFYLYFNGMISRDTKNTSHNVRPFSILNNEDDNRISFTIYISSIGARGIYLAEENMTWREFIGSKYNDGTIAIVDDQVCFIWNTPRQIKNVSLDDVKTSTQYNGIA